MTLRTFRRLALMCIDTVMVAGALGLAYELRFDFHVLKQDVNFARQFLYILPFVVLLRILLFYAFNLYKGMLRYAGVSELLAIFYATAMGTVIIGIANFILEKLPRLGGFPLDSAGEHVQRIPWGIVLIETAFVVLFIGGVRFSRRVYVTARSGFAGDIRRVLIIGAGDVGEAVARTMLHHLDQGYRPVVFVDENPATHGRRIHNLKVFGGLESVNEAIDTYHIDDIMIAIPDPTPKKLFALVDVCKKTRVGFKIVPSAHDVAAGKVTITQIRPVQIEDLLGRDPVKLELEREHNYLKEERVLVTGAGGSIGAELSRQILEYDPERLVLCGKGENSIYEIATELGYHLEKARLALEIGDIRDFEKMQAMFEKETPSIVFHAAAHKHVSLMELHPDEAVKNNVLGTLNVAMESARRGVKKFVLISTDKAVRPTSVMGASKRVAELIIFSLARQFPSTSFTSVRFGNVLGSRGSVIPLFKRQIDAGGPVTVTHPKVERYFMTTREAVSLVILSAGIGKGGELFLLDMGEPVKIVDLARNLISLSGYQPDVDIDIVYTGLLPGEKLQEKLLTQGEDIEHTKQKKIFKTTGEVIEWQDLEPAVMRLIETARTGDASHIRQELRNLVTDYSPL